MNKVDTYDIVLNGICFIIAIIMILPFYNVVIRSVATPDAIAAQTFYLIPTSFDLKSFKAIFDGGKLLQSFSISVFVTVVGTLLSMIITTCGAYGLSKKTLPGRKFLLIGILFTMFFNGGLIPYYLNIRSLGLTNNLLVLMLPSAVNTFYLIIMINYFKSIPKSLEESANIDGASKIRTLFNILIPISKPTIAAITLFYAVDRWNSWWDALLFLSDEKKYPMQLFLREILNDATRLATDSQAASMTSVMQEVTPDGIKMATVIVTMIPIMILYPYLQKHFAAGVMMGSVKE